MNQNIKINQNITISPTNSIDSSGYSISTTSSANSQNLNRPKPCDYIKTHKNISFSFAENLNSFQLGNLGDSDTYLVGTVHLNYPRVCAVKNVFLHFKGVEKTCWYKSQARTKNIYSGEHVLVDQSNKIWEAFEESEGITTLDIPFKIQLPYGLQETITTNIGTVQYVLRACVNTKGLINIPNAHITKLHCPLRQTLILNNSLSSSYKICGESPNGIEYTFLLPPNKTFNMGSYVSIPMMIRFSRPGLGIDRLEISLKALMDFSCSTQNEKTQVEQKIGGLLISNSELRNVISNNSQYRLGEYIHNINLFVPRDIQQTYQGNLINISHQLNIKFCLFGFEADFQVDEYIRISRRRKLPQLSIHEDSSESDISSHSLPSPPTPVVNEINTNTIKSPYPTPLSPPPYRQPVIRESSFGNNKDNANYIKYKKYTE
ncbi:4073_t:CDS:2 [Diversispora eburnea]|uniref:4073_t:CDS:1 n=1 Tax=Diversispora eburnea TaxID=1213867 RepID=A0A9N9AS26_9GLOM|nr:4073_t:CDS:2 [Diversispora eburnea]